LLFVLGCWPFNFTEKNNITIGPEGGLALARHGTAYTAASPDKLHHLHHFAIYIDLVTSSDGLNSFEKIFSYFINQEEMNFILGQWKDGLGLTFRTEKVPTGLMAGMGNALKEGVRTRFLVNYDGKNILLYRDGRVGNERATGPKPFSNWDRTYPLIVGTDAGGRSQWKGVLYEVAIFDRTLSPSEVAQLSVPANGKSDKSGRGAASNKQQATRQENPPQSPFIKGGSHAKSQDNRPLVHYVFKPEYTYETEFRGRRALAVQDLGKGQAADLVIPERFAPYQRVYLGWDRNWIRNTLDAEDVVVNVLGFVPLGALLFVQFVKRGYRLQATGDRKEQQAASSKQQGKREENPPQSPFTKGGAIEIAAQPSAARNDREGKENPPVSPFFKGGGQMTSREAILAVVMAVVVGFAVSLAIEWVQAYLPSRDSSLRDLITNVLGSLIGALAAAWLVSGRKSELC
jgi:hypothetical protein